MAVEVVTFAKHVKKVPRSKNGPLTTKQKEFNENHPQLRTGKGKKWNIVYLQGWSEQSTVTKKKEEMFLTTIQQK